MEPSEVDAALALLAAAPSGVNSFAVTVICFLDGPAKEDMIAAASSGSSWSACFLSDGKWTFMYMHTKLAIAATIFGPMTSGSASIQPQRHQTSADMKFARTIGPGIDLLSLFFMTAGTVTSMEMAPTKLQKEEIRPLRKSARSAGNIKREHIWSSASAETALKYQFRLFKER